MSGCLDCQYEGARRISYDCGDEGMAVFIPVCMTCHCFVKADAMIRVNDWEGLSGEPNATCKRCGRTHMHFEGFF